MQYLSTQGISDFINEKIVPTFAPGRKLITEFIGTFFLVMTIGLNNTVTGFEGFGPLAIGCILMVMVYMGGHVSGGHYNPSVSLGVYWRGGGLITRNELVLYIVVQLFGAFVAALVVYGTTGKSFAPQTGDRFAEYNVLYIEFFYTFALVLVVLSVATTPILEGNSFTGLAIGFVVVAGGYTVGTVSGGAFNPALVRAAMVIDLFDDQIDPETGTVKQKRIWVIWVYWLACILGSALAPLVYKILNYKEPASETNEFPESV